MVLDCEELAVVTEGSIGASGSPGAAPSTWFLGRWINQPDQHARNGPGIGVTRPCQWNVAPSVTDCPHHVEN
jgi:hypothetical protein